MTTPNYPGQQPPYQPGPPQPPYQPPTYQPGPPQPPYLPGPPQAGSFAAPPPAPPKRQRWLIPTLIGGGIALVLCCGGTMIAAASGDPDKTKSAANGAAAAAPATSSDAATPTNTEAAPTPEAPEAPEAPKTYRVGQTVRGGDFEFVVRRVKCGITEVGGSFLARKAQGTFCRFDISVKNVTKKAHLFHADGTVTAQDATGREYEADGEANIYGNKDGAGFLDEINPGNSVRAFVYFDVPKRTKLTTITFDAGLFTLAEDAVVTL